MTGPGARSLGRSILTFVILSLWSAATPVFAQEQPVCDDPPCEVRYRVEIDGVEDRALAEVLRGASQLEALRDRPPSTRAGLRRRAEGDLERLRVALKSEGHYEGRVTYRLDEDDPVRVILNVEAGRAFPLRRYEIRYTSEAAVEEGVNVPRRGADVGLTAGSTAKGPAIVAAQGRAVALLRSQGYPFAAVDDRRVILDRQERDIIVTLTMTTGPRARHGPVSITGLERVEQRFVEGYIPWRKGEIYDPDAVAGYAQTLEGTGLFRSVRVRAADDIDPDGSLAVLVSLEERERRSVGFTASYSTSEGPGGTVFWEHRNLSGEGERLRLELDLATIRQGWRGIYEEPQFLRADQTLRARAELLQEETDAFDSRSVLTSLGVERQVSRTVKAGAAVEFEYARTIEDDAKTDTYLLAFPINASWDTTDDVLNPKTGLRLSATITPTVGDNEGPTFFYVSQTRLSGYQPIGRERRFVLAGRARIGSIEGEDTASIPAQRRLYAGGGGSLRAFAFQQAGPLDDDNDPVGGRGVVEAAVELRASITESIGVAPFVEAGGVYDDPIPSGDDDFFLGAGLGAWYLTPVGPFRFDVAVPLNPREGIDDDFQIYLSLGQSF